MGVKRKEMMASSRVKKQDVYTNVGLDIPPQTRRLAINRGLDKRDAQATSKFKFQQSLVGGKARLGLYLSIERAKGFLGTREGKLQLGDRVAQIRAGRLVGQSVSLQLGHLG